VIVEVWQEKDGRKEGETKMNRRDVHRSCTELINDLNLPIPAEPEVLMDRLCELMAERLGEPVHYRFVSVPIDADFSGVWAATEFDGVIEHYILIEENTSPWHQVVIFCHEAGHMMVGHETVPVEGDDALQLVFPTLPAETVARIVAGRTHCSTPAEKKAELFGSMLQSKVSRWLPRQEWVVPDAATDVVRRLENSLGRTNRGHRE
jgi:hypothetical protein